MTENERRFMSDDLKFSKEAWHPDKEDKWIMPPPTDDAVVHPSHYTTGSIETWDYIVDQELSYLLGNVVKYVSRAGKKGTAEDQVIDLKKARQYLEKEIARLDKSEHGHPGLDY